MQDFRTLTIYQIYPHKYNLFYPKIKNKRKNFTLYFETK
jgi:hypothetical protein